MMLTGYLNNAGKILVAANQACDPKCFRISERQDGNLDLQLVCATFDIGLGSVDRASRLGAALRACSTLDVMFPNNTVIENLRRAA